MDDQKFAFTVEEASRKSNCGRTLIFEAIKRGELASLKIGKKRLVTPDQLTTWLARHEVKPS